MTALPTLYSFRRCPYAMRARLGLASSGFEVELREIVLRDKPQPMLEASPKGTVPVLILDDGRVIDESLDIMLFALEQADPDSWLTPEVGSLDEMLALIAALDAEFKPYLDAYKYPNRTPDKDPKESRDKALAHLGGFGSRLNSHTYLFGNKVSLADMATFPFVRQFAHVDKEWFAASAPQKVQQWLSTHLESVLFKSIMTKYSPWREGDPLTIFPSKIA